MMQERDAKHGRRFGRWLGLAVLVAGFVLVNGAVPQATAATGPSLARPSPTSIDILATGALHTAPAGYINFCASSLARCRAAGPVRLSLDGSMLALLRRVQHDIDAAIRPEAEPAARDWWQINPKAGDCEDYALSKQAALIESGLPAGALRLATALTETGESHAVLTVETDRGTVVLDNRFGQPVFWQDLPYRWLLIQAPDQPFRWRQLAPGLLVTAS